MKNKKLIITGVFLLALAGCGKNRINLLGEVEETLTDNREAVQNSTVGAIPTPTPIPEEEQ